MANGAAPVDPKSSAREKKRARHITSNVRLIFPNKWISMTITIGMRERERERETNPDHIPLLVCSAFGHDNHN
jgi:hypothetical protein